MKLGKIYTWANREEARHLIGKEVVFSDSLKSITERKKQRMIERLKEK